MQYILIIIFLFPTLIYSSECDIKIKYNSGGYKELIIKKRKLIDVESFKVKENNLFYATSPVYGQPEIGQLNCKNGEIKTIVKAKNFTKSYPKGSDFFRLKDIIQKNEEFEIWYYYSESVDDQDFNNFEKEKNLKMIKFKN